MKQIINKQMFIEAFQELDRVENFGWEGLSALYDYIIDFEEDTGEEIELDVIALCCEFAQYDSLEQVTSDYRNIETLEDLYNHTTVIEYDGGLIIRSF